MSSSGTQDFIVGDTSLYRTEYDPADAVAAFHTLPRFSHSGDFSLLFSDNPHEVSDYSKGLLFVACLVISFFCVWGLLLLLFKCLGEKRVGTLSGHPYTRKGCASMTGRTVFLVSSIIVFIFSILLVTKGVTPLEYTKDRLDASNQDVIKIHDELAGISQNLRSVAVEATPVRDQLVTFLHADVCPLTPGSQTETVVRKLGHNALIDMQELGNFIEYHLDDMDEALNQVTIATDNIDQAVEEVAFTGGLSAAMLVPFLIIPSFLVVALIMGWWDLYSDTYYRFITWLVLPIFILMVIFAFTVSGFAALGTEANADFCAGGPDSTPEGTIDNILAQYALTGKDFYYRAITFYSNQCQTENPFEFLQIYYDHLTEAKASLDALAENVLSVSTEQLSQECGVPYGPALQLVKQLQVYTSILLDSTDRSMDLMSCSKIVPLYTTSVYEGLCHDSVKGATWIFASFFVIAFFGMNMIMLRASYWPIYYYDSYDNEKSLGYSEDGDALDDGVSGQDESAYGDSAMESEAYYDNKGQSRNNRFATADGAPDADGDYGYQEEISGYGEPDGDTQYTGITEK